MAYEEEEEDLRAEWFTWEWVRDVWVKRGVCDVERGNEIIAALEKEISDPHELLTRIGKERIAAMVRAGYTPEQRGRGLHRTQASFTEQLE